MNIDYKILNADNAGILEHFLYEAIYVPEGAAMPPYEIIYSPELEIYLRGFGTKYGDLGIVAEVDGKAVGAAWARIINDYGHVDDNTPSVAISVDMEYRGKGIGKELLSRLHSLLENNGFDKSSLSVQKENFAVKMYLSAGYKVVKETAEEYIMIRQKGDTNLYKSINI